MTFVVIVSSVFCQLHRTILQDWKYNPYPKATHIIEKNESYIVSYSYEIPTWYRSEKRETSLKVPIERPS